jgi:hypothetical protein
MVLGLGPDEDAGDIPDILGIKVEKLATNVGKGMGSFVTHRGKCYQLAEWPRSGVDAVTTFFDEQRQREIIEGALQTCVGGAAEARSPAGILDPATEESSRRFVWRLETAS